MEAFRIVWWSADPGLAAARWLKALDVLEGFERHPGGRHLEHRVRRLADV
jgi:hypothetical protein